MEIVEFKKQIVSKDLKPFYILTGEEIGIMNIYLNQLPGKVVRANSISSVWNKLTNRGIVTERTIYIIRDDADFLKSEKIQKRVGDIKHATLILCYTKLDKRGKFYKRFKDDLVLFEKLTTNQLVNQFVNKYPKFNDLKIQYVVELCDNDYSRIDNELDKLSRIEITDFTRDAEALIYRKPEVDVFAITNAVVQYELPKAMKLACIYVQNGESSLPLLTMIYNNFKNAAKIFLTKSKSVTAEELGMKPFQLGNIKKNFNYPDESITSAMKVIGEAIEGIKNGRYNESNALYIALLKLNRL